MATDFRMRAQIKNLLGKITVKKNQSVLFCIKYYFVIDTDNLSIRVYIDMNFFIVIF